MTTTNLVITAYGGDRRGTDVSYSWDRGVYLRVQFETLTRLKHDCHVTIMDSGGRQDYLNYVELLRSELPVNWEIVERENNGLSYGAFSDAYERDRGKYDYWIFLEDDYVFTEDNFDKTMIELYEAQPNCGYLCTLASGDPPHASVSNGMFRADSLKDIRKIHGKLPYGPDNSYSGAEGGGQVALSYAVLETGRMLYDMTNRYRAAFMGGRQESRYVINYGNAGAPALIVPVGA